MGLGGPGGVGVGGSGGVQDGCPLTQVTLWMMCVERCLVQLSTLHSKRPFFNPRVSHLRARTLLPPKPPLQPLPHPPPRLQSPSSFLLCFPWPWSKSFMWRDWGRLEVDPWSCPQKTLVFQRDESLLVLAGWSRRVEGFIYFTYLGDGWNRPTGVEDIKAPGHFHIPLIQPACTCRGVETRRAALFIHIYHLKITGN